MGFRCHHLLLLGVIKSIHIMHDTVSSLLRSIRSLASLAWEREGEGERLIQTGPDSQPDSRRKKTPKISTNQPVSVMEEHIIIWDLEPILLGDCTGIHCSQLTGVIFHKRKRSLQIGSLFFLRKFEEQAGGDSERKEQARIL